MRANIIPKLIREANVRFDLSMIENKPSEPELKSRIEFNSLLSSISLVVNHKININPQERTNIMNVGV